MDIILTDSAIRKFLDTQANSEILSQNVSLCGPTFDKVDSKDSDTIYQIETITNRVDTACALGIAREASIILSRFNIPAKLINDPYQTQPRFSPSPSKQFHFNIEKNLVVRFTAIALENITVKPSPLKTQQLLENCGQRPINNCVDITNELTLLYGMPSHIFDLDKLASQNLTIRESVKGETITTLDNQQNELSGGEIVIEDGTGRLVDLCGLMGGQVAELDEHTKNILFIVPVYHHEKIRRASLNLQKRTLASQIYEKQPDPEICLAVLQKGIELLASRASGKIFSPLFDYYPEKPHEKTLSLDFNWLNSFVGINIPKEDVVSILAGLGFGGSIEKDCLLCTVPSWRFHDINIKEDLAEEVARIYGYFRLPSQLPYVNLPVENRNLLLETETKTKRYLSAIGFHEIYNHSLVSADLLKKTLLNPEDCLRLKNPLSLDYEYLRTTLLPSALNNHKNNHGKTAEAIETFEIANCYQKINGQDLPNEVSTLAMLSGLDYLTVKGKLESLFPKIGIKDVSFKPSRQAPPFFDPHNTAEIFSEKTLLGYLGLIKPLVLRNFGLPSNPTAIEINLVNTVSQIQSVFDYQPISEYPFVLEDITIDSSKHLGDIINTLKTISPLIKKIHYLESYHTKHTFRISFGSDQKNLSQEEVNSLKNLILKSFSTSVSSTD